MRIVASDSVAETPPLLAPDSDATASDVETCYRDNHDLIVFIVGRKFKVPQAEVENLVQEVFLAYVANAGRVSNVRPWLVAVACNAARTYWRNHERSSALPHHDEVHAPHSGDLADLYLRNLTIRQMLGQLGDRQRMLLHLHYYEGLTAREIAERLRTTHRYVEKLLHGSVTTARRIYFDLSRPARL